MRTKLQDSEPLPSSTKAASVSEAVGGYQDRNLTWKDIAFVRRHTHLPIIIKGVQSVEDVQLCVEHGAEGVILVCYAPDLITLLDSRYNL